MSDLIDRQAAIDAFYKYPNIGWTTLDVLTKINALPSANQWIPCSEPPSTEKNVFICFGTAKFKSVCIGHYEPSMKMWYEDRKFFASPIYDALCYCDIPDIPEKYRGEQDE